MAWLHTVLRHEALAVARARRREGPNGEADLAETYAERVPDGLAVDAVAEWRDRYRVIQDGLAGLTDAQRICLILQSGGASYERIRQLTGLHAAQGRAIGARGAGEPAGLGGPAHLRRDLRAAAAADRPGGDRRGHGARAPHRRAPRPPLRALPGPVARPPRVERVAGRAGAGRVPRHGDPRRAPAGPEPRPGLVGPPGRRRDGQGGQRHPDGHGAAERRPGEGGRRGRRGGGRGSGRRAARRRRGAPGPAAAAHRRDRATRDDCRHGDACQRRRPHRPDEGQGRAIRRRPPPGRLGGDLPPGRSRGPTPLPGDRCRRGPIRRPRASRPGQRRPRRRRPPRHRRPRPCRPPRPARPRPLPPRPPSPWSSAREARATRGRPGRAAGPGRGPRGGRRRPTAPSTATARRSGRRVRASPRPSRQAPCGSCRRRP